MEEWLKKIKTGMNLISEGCNENKHFANCRYCPFEVFCDVIAESGYNIDIPENWNKYE